MDCLLIKYSLESNAYVLARPFNSGTIFYKMFLHIRTSFNFVITRSLFSFNAVQRTHRTEFKLLFLQNSQKLLQAQAQKSNTEHKLFTYNCIIRVMLEEAPNKQQGAMRGAVNISVNRLTLNFYPSMCVGYCAAGDDVFQMRRKISF